MSRAEEILCDAEGFDLILGRLTRDILEACGRETPLRLIGVRSRGVPVAERLAKRLQEALRCEVPVGAIDITLYRDDLDTAQRWPVLRGTEIDFDVDGAQIVLVDDVLFTGRTTRAALNVVCDLGRPSRVRLLTVIDRGHRELPIQADFIGMSVRTKWPDRVLVQITPVDAIDQIVLVRPQGHEPRSV